MKKYILLFLIFSSINILGQIKSGEYEDGLNLAYNKKTNRLTGYFESYTGYDEETKDSKFSCIFYIEFQHKKNKIEITTYFPKHKEEDIIKGEFRIIKPTQIQIKLEDEHGGCWNVQHFNDKLETFNLDTEKKWIEIRYINIPKSYFYSEKNEISKQRAFLIKGDVIFIDTIDGNWVHCIYKGKKITQGWIKLDELNTLQ